MVRLVDDLLRTRLGHDRGFASPGVTVVDPGVGTGTFLFRVMDRIADAVSEQDGPGAVGPRLRQAAERLIGFELQAGPYSVAEVRLSTEFARLGAPLGPRALRVYLTDTLANPNEVEEHLPVIYAPIAESRTRANQVKREEPVMVVLGNPPYRERSYGDGGWIEQGDLRPPVSDKPEP
jgi:predicted helicase